MLTTEELREMEQDLIQMDRDRVEQICMDVLKERLFDYEHIKEELRQINNGERVVLPKDKEHAKFMLIISMNYLGIKPGQPITYGDGQ
jgi:hypothetical protein